MSRTYLLPFLPAVGWMALIFVLSSLPSPDVSSVDWVDYLTKKTAHVVVYAVLAASLYLPLRGTRWASVAAPLAFVLTVAFAASDEFHQAFTGRTSLATDVLIDAMGAVAGLVLAYAIAIRFRPARG